MRNLRLRLFLVAVLWCGIPSPSQAASAVPRTAVTTSHIVATLQAVHVPVQTLQVHLLSATTLGGASTLRVTDAVTWQDDAVMARMQCAKAGDCVPFFVVLRWEDPQERESALSILQARHTEGKPKKQMLVRAGEKATLIQESKQMRLTTPIICLESGGQGEKVRVRSMDHKRVVLAEVIDQGLVKSSF